ncbi:MAG: hypothetical protein A2104_02530 [Candidatus Melainabacteria bacterium GWF2_32_7]|nr:MAG: hypothetical protein A2104_02530 [Candidatus Melainabacteria bacterium GWF2_32_7]
MTVYYSEKTLRDETITYLRKDFPRGEISSNYFEITRASTIDYHLLLKYFDCVVAKEHNLYKTAIVLPTDLEDRIPFWFVQSNGEIWVDPNSGPKGKNIYRESLFVLRFSLYVDEEDIHKFSETRNISTEKALIGEFTEIRHALIAGNEEPIDIFKGIYGHKGIKLPAKSHTAEYLASILTVPH